jgi:hypothetical protein
MLDFVLPAYLLAQSSIATPVGNRIYRGRAPQNVTMPFIVIGDPENIDLGQTAQQNLLREIGTHFIIVAGQQLYVLDPIVTAIETLLKAHKNGYIPSAGSNPKQWVQCFIIQDRMRFNDAPIDGDQSRMLGYILQVRAAYDTRVSS